MTLDEGMREYYRRRAGEYDDWWNGTGLYAELDRPGWAEEVAELIEAIGALEPARTLDVACGTGFLTRHLRGEVVGLDQSAAMVEIAATRLPDGRTVCAEATPLPFADGAFERIFTSHFYGHLLDGERVDFLAQARRVAGELVVVDAALAPGRPSAEWQERVLRDGSRHRVFKRWFSAASLGAEVGATRVLHAGAWFVAVAG
ncbi:MAG TPA: methyltransferase domain-containing protein [Solirubrobacteraceae bacterium]|jgi:demethylmenaquinone methyltransferase/2-methoxy-6-polyprenyl-1,4-benzoquinol methylase|nr:methyltransferase domain-containing protein [Solirubrobacteraceae bacterium]